MSENSLELTPNLTIQRMSAHGVTEMTYPVHHLLEGAAPGGDRTITPVLNKKYISLDVIIVDDVIYSYRETLPDGTRVMEKNENN